jgi:peroxiredoxin
MLAPGTQAPELTLQTVGGDGWSLREQEPDNFTMIVFYRGLHCPVCRTYLKQLHGKLDEFRERGAGVIAVSGDSRERAEKTSQEWGLEGLRIGYGQSIESMREWGLFISRAIKDEEPAEFGEPGLFLIRPDGTVYYEAVQNMPFARPPFDDLLGAIDFVLKTNYPARGQAVAPAGRAELEAASV